MEIDPVESQSKSYGPTLRQNGWLRDGLGRASGWQLEIDRALEPNLDPRKMEGHAATARLTNKRLFARGIGMALGGTETQG